jgi:hypothetical protein
MKNINETKKNANMETVDLLEVYRDQTVNEGKHDAHIDGYTYGDYSDSCCC